MSPKCVMGRPKSRWNPETDAYVQHARDSNATASALAAVLQGAHAPQNPMIRLAVADGVLHMESELREARRQAIQECRGLGRTWKEIGRLIGVNPQRAWSIGKPK